MKIVDVRVVRVEFPKHPVPEGRSESANKSWALRVHPINKYAEFSRSHGEMPGAAPLDFWVQVVAEDGTWGLGAGSYGPPVTAIIEHNFAPLLIGRDCMAVELLNDLMWRSSQRLGGHGLMAIARSAVDLALWDLKGRLLQQPVYSLLGGPVRETLETYVTTDDLEWAKELGFRRFKVSNPAHYEDEHEGLDMIEERFANAREIIGPDAELMFNPAASFNVEFTLRVAERLRPYKLRWIEEPLMPWDFDGLSELKRGITWTALATGESHQGRHEFLRLMQGRCADIVQPDVRWCGGLTEMMKIYQICEAHGIATIPHTAATNPFGQHFAMAAPESPIQEFWMGSDPGIPLEAVSKFPGTPVPKNGVVTPSDAPGFGLEVKEDWIVPA